MSAVTVETSNGEIEPWEVHSELVLVSPEVCKRALELLPDRDPDAFLARRPPPNVSGSLTAEESAPTHGLAAAVVLYALRRSVQTARSFLVVVGVVIALALLVELLH